MSKYQFQQSDIYIGSSDIPRNKLSITDQDSIIEAESILLAQAYASLYEIIDENTLFDRAFFIALHANVFGSLYDWAGIVRAEDMSKGGSLFCRAAYLLKEMDKLFNRLLHESVFNPNVIKSKEAFARSVAEYQCELICLHPFYELNGRITRLFFDLIAIQNGFNIIDYDWALMQSEKNNVNYYIQASIDCVQFACTDKLYQIILNGLSYLEGQPA